MTKDYVIMYRLTHALVKRSTIIVKPITFNCQITLAYLLLSADPTVI